MQIHRTGWYRLAFGFISLSWLIIGTTILAADAPSASNSRQNKTIADWEREAAVVEKEDPAKALRIRQDGLKATGAANALVEGAQFTHYKVAAALSRADKDQEAVLEYNKAMQGNWTAQMTLPAMVWLGLAESQAWLLNWPAALDASQRGLLAVPSDRLTQETKSMSSNAHRFNAVAFFMLGDTGRADEEWALARRDVPALGESPFDPAQERYNRAIAQNPGNAQAWAERAEYLTERYQAALLSDPTRQFRLQKVIIDPGRTGDGKVRAGTRELIRQTGPLAQPRQVLRDALKDYWQAEQLAHDNLNYPHARARLGRMEEDRTPEVLTGLEWQIINDYDRVIPKARPEEIYRWERAQWANDRLPLVTGRSESDIKLGTKLLQILNQDLAGVILSDRQPESAMAHLMRLRVERDRRPVDYSLLLADAKAAQKTRPVEGKETGLTAEDWADAAYTEGLVLEALAPAPAALDAYQRALDAVQDVGADRPSVADDLPYRAFRLRIATGDFDGALKMIPLIDERIEYHTNTNRLAIARMDEAFADENDHTASDIADEAEEKSWRLAGAFCLLKAALWEQTNQLDDARAAVARARECAAQSPKFTTTLGETLRGTRYDSAAPTDKPLQPLTWTDPQKPEGTAEAWKLKGNALINDRKLREAQVCYNMALLINPAYADAWNNHGRINLLFQRWDLAKSDLDRAIALDPHHISAHVNRAELFAQLRDYTAAIADLKTLLEILPADSPQHPAVEKQLAALQAKIAQE